MRNLSFLALVAFPVLVGCGGVSDAPDVAKVSGQVLVDGKGLEGLTVRFVPDSARGTTGPMSTAVTTADGNFVLTTAGSRAGAVIGEHKVCVECPFTLAGPPGTGAPVTADGVGSGESGEAPPAPPANSGPPCNIPLKYYDSASTPLTATVTEEGGEDFLLQVSTK